MSSSSNSVFNWSRNSRWNSIFFDPMGVVSNLCGLFSEHFTFQLQLYVQFIVEHNRSVVISLLTWVMTAKHMTLSGQFVWMYSISTFAGP